jgi:methyl-accepting chemotaxis protein
MSLTRTIIEETASSMEQMTATVKCAHSAQRLSTPT